MQKHISSFSFLFVFLLSLNFLSCDKEQEIKDYPLYPLDFNLEKQPNGSYKFSWTATNTSDFKEYRIVRRINDSVPYVNDRNLTDISSGSLNNPELMVVARIMEANQTTFIDSSLLFSGKSYFRVFAFLGDRVLSSVNRKIDGLDNIFEKEGVLDDIYLDNERNLFYVFDTKKMRVTSINAFTMNNQKTAFTNFNSGKEICSFKNKNSDLLYVPNGFGSYEIMSLPNLNIIGTDIFFSQQISMIIGRDSFVVTTGNFNNLLSRERVKFFGGFPNSLDLKSISQSDPQPILRWNSNENEVLSLSVGENAAMLNVVSLAGNGTLTLRANIPLTLKSKVTFTTLFRLTPQNTFILLDEQGLIIDSKTLAQKGSLSDRTNQKDIKYIDFTFSTDEKFVYALRESRGLSGKKIDVFNYPSFDYVKSIDYVSKPNRLFYHDNKLKAVGKSPNSVDFRMFEVIKP
jgi:hypothetical protein